MHKNLKIILMATAVVATFSSLTAQSRAQADSISLATDNKGHDVYVNDGPAIAPARRQPVARRQLNLAYWSASEHRWKPVKTVNVATMRAARSAAAEVDSSLGQGAPQATQVRSRPTQESIDAAIEQAAARHNVDANLVRAVVKVESNFNPNAVSRKGAMGLMQLMPQTARQLKVDNPFDPQQNIDAGVRHLKKLMESYGGDVKLSLAAYNAGAGAVARSAGIPNFVETRNYVRRITQLYYAGSNGTGTLGAYRAPVHMERDARGVLYISNTD